MDNAKQLANFRRFRLLLATNEQTVYLQKDNNRDENVLAFGFCRQDGEGEHDTDDKRTERTWCAVAVKMKGEHKTESYARPLSWQQPNAKSFISES